MPLVRYYLGTILKIVTVTNNYIIQSDSNNISDPGSAFISSAGDNVPASNEIAAVANRSL